MSCWAVVVGYGRGRNSSEWRFPLVRAEDGDAAVARALEMFEILHPEKPQPNRALAQEFVSGHQHRWRDR